MQSLESPVMVRTILPEAPGRRDFRPPAGSKEQQIARKSTANRRLGLNSPGDSYCSSLYSTKHPAMSNLIIVTTVTDVTDSQLTCTPEGETIALDFRKVLLALQTFSVAHAMEENPRPDRG